MNIRLKLTLFFGVMIASAFLYYRKFAPNIQANGLLSFIGLPTIIIVVLCHGIALLIRSSLVSRIRRSRGTDQGKPASRSAVTIADAPLVPEIKKSFARTAGLFLLTTAALSAVVYNRYLKIKDIPKEVFEQHVYEYFALVAIFVCALITVFFAVHFLLTAFLLEYESRVKDIYVTVLSYMIVFLIVPLF